MCPDPYTGAPGVTEVGDGKFRVTSRIATRKISTKITIVFRLMETEEQSRLVFSPLLVRFLSGENYLGRAVKVSDSGRIRNELQTLMSQALEYVGDTIRVHFDWLDEAVLTRENQELMREILLWYKDSHPVWFHWLEIA